MKNPVSNTKRPVDRRSFMKSGFLAGGAPAMGVPGSLQNRSSLSPAQKIQDAEAKINAERFLEMHRAV